MFARLLLVAFIAMLVGCEPGAERFNNVDITGASTTSHCWKKRCQAQRIWVRASFSRCQSRARMVWARSTWAWWPM